MPKLGPDIVPAIEDRNVTPTHEEQTPLQIDQQHHLQQSLGDWDLTIERGFTIQYNDPHKK